MSDHAATAEHDSWTTRRLLAWIPGFLGGRGVDAPRVVAEMLMAHVFGCERMRLYMEVDRPAAPEELERLRDLVARAGRREPVHYLVGEAAFYWRSFEVGPSTLIPQPCTETLVDWILQRLGGDRDGGATAEGGGAATVDDEKAADAPEDGERPRTARELLLADVGTGSGCIAVTLAAQLPGAVVVATDIVPGALELAGRNATRHGVAGRVELAEGSLAAPLQARLDREGRRFDAIAANLPYIPEAEHAGMDPSVRDHVPRSAWDGGPDGLALVGPFLGAAPRLLAPGGLLAVEVASAHAGRAADLARAAGLVGVEVLADQDGLPRVLVGERISSAS